MPLLHWAGWIVMGFVVGLDVIVWSICTAARFRGMACVHSMCRDD